MSNSKETRTRKVHKKDSKGKTVGKVEKELEKTDERVVGNANVKVFRG